MVKSKPIRINDSCVYILCGLPFSGKSTLARELARRFGLEHVEIDRINSERGVGFDGAPISQQEWTATYSESFRQLERCLANGRSAVYDATNFTRQQRDRVRRIAGRFHACAAVIHLDLPDEARRRWQVNRLSGERYDVRDDDFAQVADNFEPPTDDEETIRYDGQTPLDEWLEQFTP